MGTIHRDCVSIPRPVYPKWDLMCDGEQTQPSKVLVKHMIVEDWDTIHLLLIAEPL